MANAPITIGPFANVPAPGSPIRSDWPQQISTYVWQHAPRTGVSIGPDTNYTATGLASYATVPIPAVAWATKIQFAINFRFGFANAAGAVVDADVTTLGATVPGTGIGQRNADAAGRWSSTPIIAGYDVAANVDPSFTIRANILALGGGNCHVQAIVNWQQVMAP